MKKSNHVKSKDYRKDKPGREKARELTRTKGAPGGFNKGLTHKKATRQEAEERVEQIVKYLSRWPLASDIELRKEFIPKWQIGWPQLDEYSLRARSFIKRQANMTPEEARNLGVTTLIDLVRNGEDDIRVKAEKSLREIFGYSSAVQVRIGNPDGTPIETNVVVAPTVTFVLPAKRQEQKAIDVEGKKI